MPLCLILWPEAPDCERYFVYFPIVACVRCSNALSFPPVPVFLTALAPGDLFIEFCTLHLDSFNCPFHLRIVASFLCPPGHQPDRLSVSHGPCPFSGHIFIPPCRARPVVWRDAFFILATFSWFRTMLVHSLSPSTCSSTFLPFAWRFRDARTIIVCRLKSA